ncbi:MAG: glucosaminidase domain-containing protein [Bacteroidetes bacterium]|nr:glucosaminidase domain-containing protein [Bacteroidota bacterium]
MQKWLTSIVLMLCACKLYAQDNDYDLRVKTYIEQYKALAISEQRKSGIPASITLAQGLHETTAGASELATQANNHFGIKCKKEWTGATFAHTDDAPNECFRKYEKAEDSYRDHSEYLSKSPRYAELFKLSPTDYAAWAIGLKRCGYATNPRYAQVLIKLIEDYHLQEFTYAALDKPDLNNGYASNKAEIVPEHDPTPAIVDSKPAAVAAVAAPPPAVVVASAPPEAVKPVENNKPVDTVVKKVAPKTVAQAQTKIANKPAYGDIVKVNGLRAIYGQKGETPLLYAYKASMRYSKFLEINEIDERPLPCDMYLYLEKKNTKGQRPLHIVKPEEKLFMISQEEGVDIKSLMAMNKLQAGEEPVAGSVLELQRTASVKPVIVGKINAAPRPVQTVEVQLPSPANKANTVATTQKVQPVTALPVQEPKQTMNPAEEAAGKLLDKKMDTAIAVAKSEPLKRETVLVRDTIAKVQPAEIIKPELKKEDVKVAETKIAPPPIEEEPKDELDKLKKQFDKVVYAKNDVKATAPTVAAETAEKKPLTGGLVDPAKYYTVKKGDTGFSIAKQHGITLKQLMEWNNLDFAEVKEGQKLRIKQ